MITSLQKKEIQTKKEHGVLHLDFITNIYWYSLKNCFEMNISDSTKKNQTKILISANRIEPNLDLNRKCCIAAISLYW